VLTPNDLNEFVKCTKQDDALIILSPNQLSESPAHDWCVIKSPFEGSKELTNLNTAAIFCYEILDCLGMPVRYKHLGLRLEIQVVVDKENTREH